MNENEQSEDESRNVVPHEAPFSFDPDDPLAPIRAVEDVDPDKLTREVGKAVQAMAVAGVLDPVTEAVVKDYIVRKKLLKPGAFAAIVRAARPRQPKAEPKPAGADDEQSGRAAFEAMSGEAPGAQILDEMDRFMARYLVFPNEHCRYATVLWAAHTHVVESFYVTPRLLIDSAEPECGKTRLLELLALFSQSPKMTFNTTVAALYRRLAKSMLTLLLDEADAIWSAKAGPQAEDLRALINAGYKRGATVDRCVGEGASMDVVEFPVFAPAAIAGIAGNMPRTVVTRSITIHLRRRAPGDVIESYEEEDAAAEAAPVRARLTGWCNSIKASLRGARPQMPSGVVDRRAEIWRAPLAVADAAGGEWPERAREACKHLALGTEVTSASLGVRLLRDLKDIFGDRDRMKTTDIVPALIGMDEAPWGDLYGKPIDARKLSDLLRRYDVVPAAFDVLDGTGKTAKGYTTYPTPGNGGLYDAWMRYISANPAESGKTGKDGKSAGREPDGTDRLAESPVRHDPHDPVTVLTVSRDSLTGPLSSGLTDLTALTGKSSDDTTRSCPDCAEPLHRLYVADGIHPWCADGQP